MPPWYLGINGAWPAALNTAKVNPGNSRITVAVIDSGVSFKHPLLIGKVLHGIDIESSGTQNNWGLREPVDEVDTTPQDGCNVELQESAKTHGTEVASLIAGGLSNLEFGVNKRAYILPVRVVGKCNKGRDENLIKAIEWAAGKSVPGLPINSHPARVINLSMNFPFITCAKKLGELTTKLQQEGVFIVAAAGNNNGGKNSSPSNCPGVISVGSLTSQNTLASYSSMDESITVYAPGGGGDLSDQKFEPLGVGSYMAKTDGNGVRAVIRLGAQGTSYSAPLVAGFISLWLSRNPDLLPEDFLAALELYGRDVPNPKDCKSCNFKGLDGYAMMTRYKRQCTENGALQMNVRSQHRQKVWASFELGHACKSKEIGEIKLTLGSFESPR